MKRTLHLLFFLFFHWNTHAQDGAYKSIFSENDIDLTELKQLNQKASELLDSGNNQLEKLKEVSSLLIKLSQDLGVEKFTGLGYFYEGSYYNLLGNREKAVSSFHLALIYFKNAGDIKGMADANFAISEVYFVDDNYKASLNYGLRALEGYIMLNRRKESAATHSLLCDVLSYMGNYEEAIGHCINSLKIQESLDIIDGKQITLNSIGKIYKEMGAYEKAAAYYQQSLEVARAIDHPYSIATALSNLGNLHLDAENDGKKALNYFQQAYELDSLYGDAWGLAYSYHDLGKAYNSLEQYDIALDYLQKAKKIAEESNLPEHLANVYIDLAKNYAGKQQYINAINELKKARNIAQRINATAMLRNIYKTLSRYYDLTKDNENALIYMKLYVMQAEKLYKEQSARAIAEAETIYELEKKEKEIALLKQENEINSLQKKQNQYTIYALAGFLFIFLATVFILYKIITIKQKSNVALELKNAAINQQKEEIQKQRDAIIDKNKILSEQNMQITDSIYYARQIQQSLLPGPKHFKMLFPNSFVFYRPRDIVSGDFYWFAEIEGKRLLAVVDCTGHGVPGAFMTIMANSLLNQIVLESQITSPDLVISMLDQKIKQNLHQDDLHSSSTDGLNIGFCSIDMVNEKIQFSGAKIPLYYFDAENQLKELKGGHYSVGSTLVEDKQFNLKEIKIKSQAILYMASDGFQNQFGGEGDKKFMKSRFKNLLNAIHRKPIVEQEEIISRSYQQWRKNTPQTDDILVLGIKL